MLFALFERPLAQWNIGDFAIMFLIIVGIIGVSVIVAEVCGFKIPIWVWKIVGIVFAVAFGIIAIKFLMSL